MRPLVFALCSVLFTVLITIYVVSINRTSCYRNHNFSSGIKILPTKKSEIPEFILKRRKIAKSICDKRN